jgi:hypothetical protein
MRKLKFFLIFFVLCSAFSWCLAIYYFIKPDFNDKQCETVRENYKKIQIGMNKDEVLLLIGKEPRYQISRYPGIFPEQKTVWEFWMLCSELNSCIFDQSVGRVVCHKWQMIAFDNETEKLVKIFSDDLEKIGFD